MFDPTKAGYSSVSINGVYGRTPRIELDGLDITDETVGTTTQNIGLSSLEEFSISRSFLDLSTELTAAGAVNLSTRSGTNGFHGMGYYGFRDKRAGFADFLERRRCRFSEINSAGASADQSSRTSCSSFWMPSAPSRTGWRR